ncbi:MAG: OmpH family outer membrane protein [Bacteroidales bacterium]
MEKKKFPFAVLALIGAIVAIVLSIVALVSNPKVSKSEQVSFAQRDSSGLRIAYVNFDSIMTKCLIVDELLKNIENKNKQAESDINSKKRQLEKDAAYFQEQVQKGSISEQSAQEIYYQLLEKEQEIYELTQQYADEVTALNIQSNAEVYGQVITFLQRYNKDYQYFDYVLNYSITNPALLDANTAMDITDIVVDSLNVLFNKNYKNNK